MKALCLLLRWCLLPRNGGLSLRDENAASMRLPESADGAPTDAASSATTLAAGSLLSSAGAQALPSNIGGYRILRLLGEGGMGTVEAEQENPHRTVALKVIRAGFATGEMLRRFDNEAQGWDSQRPLMAQTRRFLKGYSLSGHPKRISWRGIGKTSRQRSPKLCRMSLRSRVPTSWPESRPFQYL